MVSIDLYLIFITLHAIQYRSAKIIANNLSKRIFEIILKKYVLSHNGKKSAFSNNKSIH